MEHPYGEDDFARTAMKRKHNTYNHFNGGTFYEAVADSALRLKRENIQLKEEKKDLEEKMERLQDANRYRYMIS